MATFTNTEEIRKMLEFINRQARYNYTILEAFECGIALTGTEIKSVRQGRCNLKEAWCDICDGELYVKQLHISPYEQGNIFNTDPLRVRKLLAHKREIRKMQSSLQQEGIALVPLKLYFKNNKLKMEVGIAKGKKNYDKREAEAKATAKREIERAMRNH